MRWDEAFNPWLCAGVLVRVRWATQPTEVQTRTGIVEIVEPGDMLLLLRTPSGPIVVTVDKARKEVAA